MKHNQQDHGRKSIQALGDFGSDIGKARKALPKLGFVDYGTILGKRTGSERNLDAVIRHAGIFVDPAQSIGGDYGRWSITDVGRTPAGRGLGRFVLAIDSKSKKQYYGLISANSRAGSYGSPITDFFMVKDGLDS